MHACYNYNQGMQYYHFCHEICYRLSALDWPYGEKLKKYSLQLSALSKLELLGLMVGREGGQGGQSPPN